MKNLFLISLLICTSIFGFAQGEYNNWCFGPGTWMDFNTGVPLLKSCSINSVSSASSISDKYGNLLFYGDSDSVWNKNHTTLPNSGNLIITGGSQFINFLPFPCNDSLFYIIHTGNNANPYSPNIYYSVINLNANGGLGGITTQNIKIDSNIVQSLPSGVYFIKFDSNNTDYSILKFIKN